MWQLGNGSRRPCPILEIPRRTHVCTTSKAKACAFPPRAPPPPSERCTNVHATAARALTLLPLAWFFQRDHSSSLKWKDSAPSYLFIECVSGSTNSKSEKQQKQLQSPRRVRRALRVPSVVVSRLRSSMLRAVWEKESCFILSPNSPTPPPPSPLWVLLGLGHPDLVADATTAACGIHRLLD